MWTLPIPSTQVPANIETFTYYVFPPVIGYFVMAALAVTPNTHAVRIALWPIVSLLASRAAFSIDMSLGALERRFGDSILTFSMIIIATRTFDWILQKEPLSRHQTSTQPEGPTGTSIMMDALDLASALRGHGWDWARNVRFPPESRPTGRGGFVFHVTLSVIAHALICGALHTLIRSFSHTAHGTLSGGSIFDDTLSFPVQYIRASLISACILVFLYAFIQACYDACTLVGVLIVNQDPTQWPPAFDAPWRATSLADFWARRWHQFFRRLFLIQGGYPMAFLVGKMGLLIGAFLSSAVLHHIGMAALDDQLEPWRMIVGFEMMVPGIIAEEIYRKWTEKRVGGLAGWIWTMSWLCVWGNFITDASARVGIFGGHLKFTESVVPLVGRKGVEYLTRGFDDWLHTL